MTRAERHTQIADAAAATHLAWALSLDKQTGERGMEDDVADAVLALVDGWEFEAEALLRERLANDIAAMTPDEESDWYGPRVELLDKARVLALVRGEGAA